MALARLGWFCLGKFGKRLYTYDGNNNQTEELFQTWDGSAWVIMLSLHTHMMKTITRLNCSSKLGIDSFLGE